MRSAQAPLGARAYYEKIICASASDVFNITDKYEQNMNRM